MDKYIKKEDMFVILDNAPKGVDKEKLIDKYVSSGFKIEGINDQPEPIKPMTGMDSATFQSTGNEGIVGGTLKTLGNIPSSGFQMAKNVVEAVKNPKQTAQAVGNIVKGAGAKVGEIALENTDLGQKLLAIANDKRIANGQEPLQQDASGKFQAINTPELEAINQVGTFLTDRYGSVDKFKETVIEDPVGVLADFSTILTGGASLLNKAGQVSTASKISSVAQAVEPISAVSKGVSGVTQKIKATIPGRIVSDIIPTVSDIKRNQVVKALDLTQGDLATISKKTGNDVTDFIVSKELIKDTPEAIADSLNDFRKAAKETKATEIAKVTNTYTPEQVPSVIKGLDTILNDVDGVAGLEDVTQNIKILKDKKTFTLEDIQNAQYIIDENSSIYSKIGDTKSSKTARGLDNIRKEIRLFIEKEVDTATNGQTNIRKLNNDIQTSYAIEDAINTRATRDLTRTKLSLGDWAALGVGTTISPVYGVGLYLGKKLIETPSFRLAFTKALSAQPTKRVKQILTEVANKTVSPETQKLLNSIADEARKNIQVVESGANVLEQTKLERKQQKSQ